MPFWRVYLLDCFQFFTLTILDIMNIIKEMFTCIKFPREIGKLRHKGIHILASDLYCPDHLQNKELIISLPAQHGSAHGNQNYFEESWRKWVGLYNFIPSEVANLDPPGLTGSIINSTFTIHLPFFSRVWRPEQECSRMKEAVIPEAQTSLWSGESKNKVCEFLLNLLGYHHRSHIIEELYRQVCVKGHWPELFCLHQAVRNPERVTIFNFTQSDSYEIFNHWSEPPAPLSICFENRLLTLVQDTLMGYLFLYSTLKSCLT